MSTARHGARLRSAIQSNLDRFSRASSSRSQIAAAVAVVVLDGGSGKPSVPLCLRPAGLSRHPDQFALPGGKLEQGELAHEAALRELREELGLGVADDQVLGTLDDFDTRSGFTITPVVVWSDSPVEDLRPSPDEVAQVFFLDFDDLQSAVSKAARGASRAFHLDLPWGPVYAPTAAILYQFSEAAIDGRPSRVNDFYQPPFARR